MDKMQRMQQLIYLMHKIGLTTLEATDNAYAILLERHWFERSFSDPWYEQF